MLIAAAGVALLICFKSANLRQLHLSIPLKIPKIAIDKHYFYPL
jgi:hypothetical protein